MPNTNFTINVLEAEPLTYIIMILHNVPHTNNPKTKMKICMNNTNLYLLRNNAYNTSK